ncbi:MAG: DNA topoisomerase III [Deltaproteobacteria bacterium]|nr:DNA topoisomerase III [Deltaproteobacteria bacterium]
MQLVIAEKPSVARDLARVLAVRPAGKTCFEGKERVITWCIGHLVELDEPASYDGRWKAWRMDTLPMLPGEFKLRAVPGTRDQLRAVCGLLSDRRFSEVVNACDAGREGELIFRYVYQLAGSRLPVKRLWISSLTDEAIRQGFLALRPGQDLEALADAARCRSEADWLVGLNATRAVTIRHRTGENSTLFSIGRVQTPTLAILVEREKQIRAFVPQDYWMVKAEFATTGGQKFPATFTLGKCTRFASGSLAETVRDRDRSHGGADDPAGPVVESLKQSKTREPPPLLFDLTSLQRTANKRFGLSAKATLEAAQALYERHKVLTYPRTDSRHLSSDMAKEMERIVGGVQKIADYAGFARPLLANLPRAGKRVFDDGKVSDHHAIIPTGKPIDPATLGRDEARVFDLVVRRFLGVFYPDAEFAQTEVVVRVGPGTAESGEPAASPGEGGDITVLPPPPDRFVARGRVRLVAGWQDVAGFGDEEDKGGDRPGRKGKKKDDEDDEAGAAALPALREGERLSGAFETLAKKTKPPSRHTEATLLSAMENAGKMVEDEELRAAMKDSGLGTPATRAAIIETLLKRGYVVREGKHLLPTGMGMGLIEALPVHSLASPELTGNWEARLARIARGQETRPAFMNDIARYVREVVDAIRQAAPMANVPLLAQQPAARRSGGKPRQGKPAAAARAAAPAAAAVGLGDLVCPACKQGHIIAGKRGWGCDRWREGCKFVVWFEEDGHKRSEADLRAIIARR